MITESRAQNHQRRPKSSAADVSSGFSFGRAEIRRKSGYTQLVAHVSRQVFGRVILNHPIGNVYEHRLASETAVQLLVEIAEILISLISRRRGRCDASERDLIG